MTVSQVVKNSHYLCARQVNVSSNAPLPSAPVQLNIVMYKVHLFTNTHKRNLEGSRER